MNKDEFQKFLDKNKGTSYKVVDETINNILITNQVRNNPTWHAKLLSS